MPGEHQFPPIFMFGKNPKTIFQENVTSFFFILLFLSNILRWEEGKPEEEAEQISFYANSSFI